MSERNGKKKVEELPMVQDIEKLYEEQFSIRRHYQEPETDSLEQPTIYKVVETVTTYGAYEDPI